MPRSRFLRDRHSRLLPATHAPIGARGCWRISSKEPAVMKLRCGPVALAPENVTERHAQSPGPEREKTFECRQKKRSLWLH